VRTWPFNVARPFVWYAIPYDLPRRPCPRPNKSVSSDEFALSVASRGKRIEQLYKDLKREFDLDDRVRIIQQKVSIISRWSQFVISRLEGHRANLLEWIIIVLILSEIVLILFGKM
jgi:hypothetical protein